MIRYLSRLASGRIRYGFCKFKYFKELANQIGYPVFKINDELGYGNQKMCWLLGYKLKMPILEQKPNQTQPADVVQPSTETPEAPQKKQIELEYDPLARQLLSFEQIQKFATKNDLDVCIADPQSNQLTLIKLRESIYRKYYQSHLHKKNSTAKKHKQIRVPQKITDHDILTKVSNIHSLINKGQFKFKIFAENDSVASQKAVRKLCGFLGKNAEIKVEKYQLQEKSRGKKSIVIQRWHTFLDFSDKSKVNYQLINKKWRRHLINLKVEKQKGGKRIRFDFEGLENEPIQIQRQALQQMRQMKIEYPSKFKQYQILQNLLEVDGKQFFFKNRQKLRKYQNSRQNINPTTSDTKRKKNNQEDEQSQSNSQSESGSESESESDLEEMKEKRKEKAGNLGNRAIVNRNYLALKSVMASQEEMKELRKQTRTRTVEDILEEMEKIRKNDSDLDSFQTQKLKTLESELRNIFSHLHKKTPNQ